MARKPSSTRWQVAFFLVVAIAIFVSEASAQTAAPANATANTTAPTQAAPAPTPTPKPTVDTYAVPAPSAVPGSKEFEYTPNIQCSDDISNATLKIYSHNRALFDQCVVDSKYTIFPYPGALPTKAQIEGMVRATSCRSVFTACVLANLKQCDIGGLALKSATETLLKISVDVLAGKEAPSSEKFYEILLWRRDVNLAQAKGIPYDQNSQLYGEFSRNLWKALTNTTVKVSADLTITLEGSEAGPTKTAGFANIATGSDASDVVGRVSAADTTKEGNFSNNATTSTSASAPRVGGGLSAATTVYLLAVGSLLLASSSPL